MAERIAEKGASWFDNLEFSLYPTTRQMRLGEMLLCHGSAKHLLFYTTEGYNSDKECETLGHEDMVYIHTWKTQRRVVARKRNHGTFISIPMDYPLKFKVLPDGQVDTLRQITTTCGLPIQVKVAPKEAAFFYQASNTRIEAPLGVLELVHIYEETYVIANYILSGDLRPEFAVIPLHLPIRGVIAYGLENHPDEVWTQLMEYYRKFIDSLKLKLDNLFDVTEIYMYNRELNLGDNDDYATITPDLYIQCDMTALPPMSDTPPPRPPRLKRGASTSVKQKSSLSLTKIKGALQSYASSFKRSVSAGEKTKERPLPPPPPVDDYCDEITVVDDEKMRDDVARVRSVTDNYEYVTAERWGQRANITPKFKPPERNIIEDSTMGPPKLLPRSISEDSAKSPPKPDIVNKNRPYGPVKSSPESVGNISKCVVHPFQYNESNPTKERMHAKLPPIPVSQKKDSEIDNDSPASITKAKPKPQIPASTTIKPNTKPKPKFTGTISDDDDNITKSVLDLAKIYDDHKVISPLRRKSEPQQNITQQLQKLPQQPQSQRNLQQQNQESKQQQHRRTQQEQQMKQENPNQLKQQNPQPKLGQHNQPQHKAIREIADIPDDLSGLSVEQVCACLRLLNMGEYTATFTENQIDGALLTSLDATTMKDSFKMAGIQAIRLEKFATANWRPKI